MSAVVNNLVSFGIKLRSRNYNLFLCWNTNFANSPVFLEWSKLSEIIYKFLSGNSFISPPTQYSAIDIVEIYILISFCRK